MRDERSANAVDKCLGHRLRARRLELGFSQERLAELLGVTFQQVQKYEKGVNRVAASRLYEIASALEVPVGYFFEGVSHRRVGVQEDGLDTAYEALSTTEGLQLLALFAGLKSSRLRRRVVELVRVLAEEQDLLPDDHDPKRNS